MSDQEQVIPLRGAEGEHRRLIARVLDGSPEDAKKALLYLLNYMNDPGRFVAGARLFDSYMRELIEEAYDLDRGELDAFLRTELSGDRLSWQPGGVSSEQS